MSQTTDKEPRNIYRPDSPAVSHWAEALLARVADGQFAYSQVIKAENTLPIDAINFKITDDDIPDGSTIDGIEVRITRKAEHASKIQDWTLHLVRNNTIFGEDKASGDFWPTTPALKTYGGATDMWSTTDITLEEIKQRDIGIRLAAYNDGGDTEKAYIDAISLRLYYTEGEPAPEPTAIHLSHHIDLP